MMGMYVLVADDTDKVYTSEHEWTPQLFDYQAHGSNTIFLTFLNPAKMPAVPPGMANLARSRGTGLPGSVPNGTTIMFAIGGQAYSEGSGWDFLSSKEKAEAMAVEVAKWPKLYGCDGIDMDIETGAGNAPGAGQHLAEFTIKLKELAPQMVVTQPVFGSPSSVTGANMFLAAGYNASFHGGAVAACVGAIAKVGIMVYSGTGSEEWVKYYTHGCDQYCTQWQCSLPACVPEKDMVLGLDGSAAAGSIVQISKDVKAQGLGGVMVWYASLLDAATGKPGLVYGSMDASLNKLPAWAEGLAAMQE
jgi:hypothetical protein